MISFDVSQNEIVRQKPELFYRIFHEGSTTLSRYNPEDPGISLEMELEADNAFQSWRSFSGWSIQKQAMIRALRWKSSAKPYSSFISVSDNLRDTRNRLSFYKRGRKCKYISVADIELPPLVPARCDGIIAYVSSFLMPEDKSPISYGKLSEPDAEVYISVQQLKHDHDWHWRTIHYEEDEWLVGGRILDARIRSIEPFDGRRIVPNNSRQQVEIHDKRFDWDSKTWVWIASRKRKFDEMELEAAVTIVPGPSSASRETPTIEVEPSRVHTDDERESQDGTNAEDNESSLAIDVSIETIGQDKERWQLFDKEWVSTLKAEIKSKMKESMEEEAQRLRAALRKEIATEIRSEMRAEMRLAAEKDQTEEFSKH